MAELTVQQITETGGAATYVSANGEGDTADNNGNMFLHIKNGGGGSITVTITALTTSVDSGVYGDLTKANASIAVASETEAFIGGFAPAAFNDGNGEIAITYSGVSSVTIAALYV
tara:strand:- start:75 stop:419 length:345 start_codon:yes stop_codon:yes gene_type:complete